MALVLGRSRRPPDARQKQQVVGVRRKLAGGLARRREPRLGEWPGRVRKELGGNDAARPAQKKTEDRLRVGGPSRSLREALEERKGHRHPGRAPQKSTAVESGARWVSWPAHGVASARNRNAGLRTREITISFND